VELGRTGGEEGTGKAFKGAGDDICSGNRHALHLNQRDREGAKGIFEAGLLEKRGERRKHL